MISIVQNREGRGGNARHNELDPRGREIEEDECMANKGPFEMIISFLKVDFDSQVSHFTSRSNHGMNNLLYHNDIITSFSSGDETSLERMNEII
jgi:hypothetical protein